jgi:hypothetical protein
MMVGPGVNGMFVGGGCRVTTCVAVGPGGTALGVAVAAAAATVAGLSGLARVHPASTRPSRKAPTQQSDIILFIVRALLNSLINAEKPTPKAAPPGYGAFHRTEQCRMHHTITK